MAVQSIQDLFNRLMPTTTPKELTDVLVEIGDYRDVGLSNPIGLGLFWHPYGNKTSNYSTIGLASKPGRSLTERITNAIDAVLEDHSAKAPSKPHSPQAAVNEWFGRPFSTSESGLYNWNYAEGGFDRKVGVVINPSDTREAPTIDVIDFGIGIPPNKFPTTILSLQEGNKITKKFLIGAFGQGGSSTLSFCEYVFIFSRHFENPEVISFTVIKEIHLGDDYKENCYAYLATKNGQGEITVPSFNLSDAINLYPGIEKLRMSELRKGTLVRHYSFRLTNIYKDLSPSEGSLYHFLHCSMFDPLIPFQIIDLRSKEKKVDQEIIRGSRNRLMRLVSLAEQELDSSNTEMRLYRPITFIKPYGATSTCIKVEYWVAFNYRKKKDKKSGEEYYDLRGDSNALFVQSRHLAVLTVNGQNQGELTVTQLMKDLALDSVAKHLVIHIDATEAPMDVKRKLFTTNRESLKDGDVLESIKQEVRRILSEDTELRAIENELVEKAIKEVTETTDDEVKKQIVKLLQEAGFVPSTQGDVTRQGNNGEVNVSPLPKPQGPSKPPPVPPTPIQTLLYPDVTIFQIVSPKDGMKIRLNGTSVVHVETDADSQYEKEIRIKIEPEAIEVASHFPLNGGRTKWRLRADEKAVVGDKGKIIVTLTKPDGDQLRSEIEYEVLQPLEKPAKEEKGFIPDFEVLPISPESDLEKWNLLWPNVQEDSKEISDVAYRPQKIGAKTIVYYSTIFGPFSSMCERLKRESPLLFKFFETNYKVWIGYHAILQLNTEINNEEQDELKISIEQEKERSRVAQMQVKQALESAKLMLTVSKQKANS
ncbi:MAG: hypothetical protein JNL53_13955 [Cyclobacteriaceae bacterium]|nr:hypothetical protein [Cyclobacteriaceae bacterium]